MAQAIFDKKNVLVLGGAGFIGSFLCEELLKTSKVICLDNFVSGQESNIDRLLANPDFEFIRADASQLKDLETLRELQKFNIKFQGLQEIYNLACPTSRSEFEVHIIDTCMANSLAMYNSLELARKYKAKYLFASSSAIYGDLLAEQTSFREDYWGFINNLNSRSSYNEGKRFAETFAESYRKYYNLDIKLARIFNTYGPRMKLNSGKMIPDFVQAALQNKDLIVYGDGTEENSYCYVTDMVEGIMKLMKSNLQKPVNLGDPQNYKIIDLAQEIIKLTNSSSQIKFAAPLSEITRGAIPDITCAKENLGWFPLVRLEDGLRRTVENMQAARSIFSYSDHKLGSSLGTKQYTI